VRAFSSKDGEEILARLLKLKIVVQAATDMQHVSLFLRYINGILRVALASSPFGREEEEEVVEEEQEEEQR